MLVDVALLTAGLYGAGGLAAAPYIAVYMVVPVYAAFVFSSRASAVATMFATVSYLTIVGAPDRRRCWASRTRRRPTPPSSPPSTCSS